MFKDIAVHLTGSDEDATRIAHAALIARSFDAHLTGIQVHEMPEILALTDASGTLLLQQLIADSEERAIAVGRTLETQLDQRGLSHELRRLDLYAGQIGRRLASEVRLSDLFVGTRPYGDPNKQQRIEETVLFESGRPCLFVPPHFATPADYGIIFIAWKNTREAARALAASLPFLRKARAVVVAIVEDGGAGEQYSGADDADVGRYLGRHGVSAEIRMINGWTNVPDALLNEALKLGPDMIVMGAYGHSRLREWALGGATRHMLKNAPVPVLVAH